MSKKLIMAALPLLATVAFASKPLDVNIIHMNDHHSHLESFKQKFYLNGEKIKVKIGGYPELVTIIKQLKSTRKNPIVLHTGDAITGTLYFTLFGGSADAELMNMTGFDYFTLGNHEFDAGNEGLKKFLDYLKVPVLSANVIPDKGSILEGYWKPYAIKEIEGEKVGIIGIDVVKKTKNSSSPGEDIKFTDEIETAQKYADLLTKMGVNKIIVFSHGGAEINLEMAKKVTNVDVIITGDTHYLFGNDEYRKLGLPVKYEYPTLVRNPKGEPVLVAEAWCYSGLVGDLGVHFNDKGVITSYTAQPIIPYYKDNDPKHAALFDELKKSPYFTEAHADPEAAKILARYKAEKDRLGNNVVGELEGPAMPGGSENRVPNKENPKGSIATRFVAETMLTQMRSFGKQARLDFTIQNAGGVRQNIEPGKVTYNDAYKLLPFGNTLVTMELTGAQVKQAIEDAIEYASTGSTGAFPYGAGIRYEANQYKDKDGHRLVKVEVQDAKTGKWSPIVDTKRYVLGTNVYIAKGKDGYVTFGKASKDPSAHFVDTFLPDAESLIKFLKLNPKFHTYTESNVLFHFDPENPITKK